LKPNLIVKQGSKLNAVVFNFVDTSDAYGPDDRQSPPRRQSVAASATARSNYEAAEANNFAG
jgi:hypothetical protein